MLQSDRFWTRRDFLKLVGGAGVISAFPSLSRAAVALNSDTVRISILHTTDLHGHILPTADYGGNPDRGGLARCVTQIRRWQKEMRDCPPAPRCNRPPRCGQGARPR